MRTRFLTLVLLLPLASGCATRGDLETLQAEITERQAAQDRLLRDIQRQTAAILDSINVKDVRLRGDVSNQLLQIERQLVQVQELTGQGQQRINELQAALRAREEALRRAEAAQAAQNDDPADAEELFSSAEGALQRGSLATARATFEDFVRSYPQHPRTPEARLYLANIHNEEGRTTQALEEYSRILELHPNSSEAASALFRAALVERGRGNVDRARSMLNQLTAAYPTSPEAGVARDELRRMR